jgi:hypothetical protein
MSGHGISPVWKARGRFQPGNPWIFNPEVAKAIFLTCGLDLIGDLNPIHNVGLLCEVTQPDPNFTHDIVLTCDIDTLGDMNVGRGVSIFCSMVAVTP